MVNLFNEKYKIMYASSLVHAYCIASEESLKYTQAKIQSPRVLLLRPSNLNYDVQKMTEVSRLYTHHGTP